MPNRVPPRYVPTLTQVVQPSASAVVAAPATTQQVAAPPVPSVPLQTIDRNALAQKVIWQVRPQLEAELRSIALELFEAQFSSLLPSLHLQIEEAVREAIEQALPNMQRDHD
jgi:hypothetical protein